MTLIIALLSCLGTLLVALFKPKLKIKEYEFCILFLPALIGSLILLFSGLLPWNEIVTGLTPDSPINPLKILVLFISTALISVFLDEVGFFRWLANYAIKKSKGNQFRLFVILYFIVSVLAVFMSKNVVILTITPIVCYYVRSAKIYPIPLLFTIFIAANTACMLLIIGNTTNIYLGTLAGIDFISYLKVMTIPTIFAVMIAFFSLWFLFKDKLKRKLSSTSETVIIEQKAFLFLSLTVLITCIVLFTISGYINQPKWLISFYCLCALLIGIVIISSFKKRIPVELFSTIRRTPWEVVPLVLSMFVIVLALESTGVAEKIKNIINIGNPYFSYGISSTVLANLMNNIPMSVLFSSLVSGCEDILLKTYITIISSNIGAYLTPIGSLAGIMWLSIVRNNLSLYTFDFKEFTKLGCLVGIPTLIASLFGLWIVERLNIF